MNELALAFHRIGRPRILVVGDWIHDTEYHCEPVRFAQEADHCPVYRQTASIWKAGGAGAVVVMAEALGAYATQSSPGHAVRALKQRFFVNGVQLFRIDTDETTSVDEAAEVEAIRNRLDDADCVLIADYGKGVCKDAVLRAAIDGANARGIPCIVDPAHGVTWDRYVGATAIKCNKHEQVPVPSGTFAHHIVTRGNEGINLGSFKYGALTKCTFPAKPRRVVDVTGAGDMVLAALGVCIAGGMSWPDACRVANAAAGLKVERRGAVPVPKAEVVLDLLDSKIIADELLGCLAGKNVVWSNGCYDGGLHRGHLHMLAEAKKQGDVLVVGVNSDASVRSLKGPGRPIRPCDERMEAVAALECVDYVVRVDSECHLDECIKAVKPAVLVKGGDWSGKPLTGQEYAGRIHFVERLPGYSTTSLHHE